MTLVNGDLVDAEASDNVGELSVIRVPGESECKLTLTLCRNKRRPSISSPTAVSHARVLGELACPAID